MRASIARSNGARFMSAMPNRKPVLGQMGRMAAMREPLCAEQN